MNFSQAISTCLSKYATFQGRATRSEFWWFYLFTLLIGWGASLVGTVTLGEEEGQLLSTIFSLVFFVPVISAGSRRLHDIGRSGWWQLLIITLIGILVLIYWWASDSMKTSNNYGDYVPTSI